MLKFVFKICPAVVIYNDKFVPEGFGGMAKGPFVFLKEKYKGTDEGILQHELVHVKQFYRTFGLFAYFYLLSKKYRLKAEVEAYKVQASYYPDPQASYIWMANALATKYKLNVTQEEALAALKE